MPVLDRATADALLNRTSPSEYHHKFRLTAAEQAAVAGPPLLQPLDVRVFRVVLMQHAKGCHVTTPLAIGQTLRKKTVSVRNSLARLRLLRLLPFEVRL